MNQFAQGKNIGPPGNGAAQRALPGGRTGPEARSERADRPGRAAPGRSAGRGAADDRPPAEADG